MQIKLEDIQHQTNDTHIEIKNQRMDKHSEDIMKWLAAPDPSTNLNKALEARHKSSGQRLLEGTTYATWKEHDNSFLWLYGIPGCGKTILASTVVEDLKKSPDSSQNTLYFYFDFTDVSKQSFEKTLCTLIYQLYHKNESVRKHVDSLYSTCENGRRQPSIGLLRTTFTEMVRQAGEVWIVLDALDECGSRDDLLPWLRDFRESEVNLHLLVTSRPEQDIESAIKCYASTEYIIAVQGELIDGDIDSYVRARVRSHKGLERWQARPDIQGEIEADLLERANGM